MGENQKMTEHDYEHTVQMVAKRLDSHGADLRDIRAEVKESAKVNRENFAIVFNELRSITNKVHHVELQGVKEDGQIKVGMATMSGEMKAKVVALGAGSGMSVLGIIEALKAIVNYFQKGHA